MTMDVIQRKLHERVANLEDPDSFIVWEAQHTYTAGRRTKDIDIPDHNIPVIPMDRGGSVTYHGPGQLVVYPVMKVRPPRDVVAFVRTTERALIDATRQAWDIETIPVEGRSGVWVRREGSQDKKLCAIGIKFANDATMHGIAYNVTTDLTRFRRIVPCGLFDAGVASLRSLGVEETLLRAAQQLLPTYATALYRFQREDRADVTPGELQWVSGRELFAHELNAPTPDIPQRIAPQITTTQGEAPSAH